MIVRTPEAGVNATVGSVTFVNGVADVDPEAQAAEFRYFVAAGYTIEPDDQPETAEEPKATPGRRAASKGDAK